jgi:pimeloyl-ACP methyl ester carboxylesterase
MTTSTSPSETVPYEMLDVPLSGGKLCVGSWGTGEVAVLAVHGLTLTHAEFHLLGECLASGQGGGIRLIAPDLRGRGGSAAHPGPFGLEAHVADVAELLKHMACSPVVLIGHSWGAVVALAVAHCHPELVRGVVLVDGGLPPAQGSTSEQSTTRASERVLARLNVTFPSIEAYLDTWRAQAGIGPYWNSHVARTFAYELTGTPPALRCSLRADAFIADLATTYAPKSLAERAFTELAHRAILVRPARNMADENRPQYSDAVTRAWLDRVDGLEDRPVENENHYTIMFVRSGAATVADLIRELLCS